MKAIFENMSKEEAERHLVDAEAGDLSHLEDRYSELRKIIDAHPGLNLSEHGIDDLADFCSNVEQSFEREDAKRLSDDILSLEVALKDYGAKEFGV